MMIAATNPPSHERRVFINHLFHRTDVLAPLTRGLFDVVLVIYALAVWSWAYSGTEEELRRDYREDQLDILLRGIQAHQHARFSSG